MKPQQIVAPALAAAFVVFAGLSFVARFEPGRQMGRGFVTTLLDMLKLLPCAFILIALFDVWVKRETVERHFGKGSGVQGYLWSILLAGTTVGGLYLAFPVAYSLHRKGARLDVVFAYVGFAGICRIPMTMFEVSVMGPTYTAVRLAVSIPLTALAAFVMGRVLEKRGYAVTE